MPFEIAQADDYLDLTDRIRKFACGFGTHDTPVLIGTGNGTIGFTSYVLKSGKIGTHPATINETWTIACTDATTPGAEVWSVTGSVSGAQVAATTGVAYSNAFIDFIITAGGTNFAVSDQFVFATTKGLMKTDGREWVVEVDEGYPAGTESKSIVLKGQGTAGGDEIYVALRPYGDVPGDYYNLLVQGMAGYITGPLQYLTGSGDICMPLWNSVIPYWIAVNGRRIVVSAKVNTVYTNLYAGFILPYATPAQYPYPLCIAANSYLATQKFSDTETHYRSIAQPGGTGVNSNGSCKLLDPGSFWTTYVNYYLGAFSAVNANTGNYVWPSCYEGMAHRDSAKSIADNLDGSRDLFPLVLSGQNNVYGEMDGCHWVSGFGSFAAEDVVTINTQEYIAFQNIHRVAWEDYWALKKD